MSSYIKQESFTFEEHFHMGLFQTSEKQEVLHCHNCLELNLVEQGTGKYIIGGKVYGIQEGDIFVINNSERHLAIHDNPFTSEDELTLTVLLMEPDHMWQIQNGTEYLKPFLQRKASFSNCIGRDSAHYDEMRYAFECIKKEAEGRRLGWKIVMEAAANMLFSLLYRHYHEQQEIQEEGSQYLFGRISHVFEYIDSHFAEEITLEQLAKEAALSQTYLCKCFKEFTGQTLFEYIEQVRVQYAGYLLQTTDLPILQIAMESGFHSVSYFNRIFKRYCGVPPGQFRRKIPESVLQ